MRNWTAEEDANSAVNIVILSRKRAAALACVVLASLSGFGGCKSSDAPDGGAVVSTAASTADRMPSSASAANTVSDARPLIICFGDSLTAGYGADAGQSYPDHLQKRLDAQGYDYHVVNAGISGETTKDGLGRVARIAARHPKIVVLEFGGNDGLRGLPLEATKSNLASMIEQLQASGAQVALAGITLPPEYGPDYIAKINAIYPALAKKYHLKLLPFLLVDVYGKPGNIQADGLHATAKGNQGVAVTVEKLIQPMLKK